MSELQRALNRIENWLISISPDTIRDFRPGLSLSEIQEIMGRGNLSFPQELIELYQWHNGESDDETLYEPFLFPSFALVLRAGFYNLEQAIRAYQELIDVERCLPNGEDNGEDIGDEEIDFNFWKSTWLPIGTVEGRKTLVNCDSNDPYVGEKDIHFARYDGLMRKYSNLMRFVRIAEVFKNQCGAMPCDPLRSGHKNYSHNSNVIAI